MILPFVPDRKNVAWINNYVYDRFIKGTDIGFKALCQAEVLEALSK